MRVVTSLSVCFEREKIAGYQLMLDGERYLYPTPHCGGFLERVFTDRSMPGYLPLHA